ncbi:MAG: hypothetical protein NWF05_08900 [Candidatus Bathyarchaeota archaeon]|nr:hypothetical protein [Candidatus Bathyarchaeota archaeon]
MENKTKENERFFSVELKSKDTLKNISLANGFSDRVLVEGSLGELVQAAFVEGVILEIIGKKGTLRINLTEKELKKEPPKVAASAKLDADSREVKQ